jgi:hypothetical protein
MKKLFSLCLVLALVPLSGCMTACVVQEARHGSYVYEPKDPQTEEKVCHPTYPWTNYLLIPVTVPLDIITLPCQVLFVLSYRGC